MSGRLSVPGKRLSRRLLLLGLPVVLALSMSSTPGFAAPPGSPSGPSLPDTKSVPVGAVPIKQSPAAPSVASLPAPIVVWPKGGSAVVPVVSAVGATTAATAGRRDAVGVVWAGGLPVSVRRSPDQLTRTVDAESSPGSVRVSVADRKLVDATGLVGVVFSLSRADGSAVSGGWRWMWSTRGSRTPTARTMGAG